MLLPFFIVSDPAAAEGSYDRFMDWFMNLRLVYEKEQKETAEPAAADPYRYRHSHFFYHIDLPAVQHYGVSYLP